MDEIDSLRESRFPLTPHDVFSYLVPGATFVILIYEFELWCWSLFKNGAPARFHTPLLTAIDSTALGTAGPTNWAVLLLYVVAVLIFTYVAGHLVASISVFLLDRILISKGYGYPYQILLGIAPHKGLKKDVSAPFYRGVFFWFNLYLPLRFCTIFTDAPWLQVTTKAIGWLLLLSIPAKLVLGGALYKLWKPGTIWLWKLYSVPYDFLNSIIIRFTRTAEQFSDKFTEDYRRGFKGIFDVEAEQAGSGNFWMTSIHVHDEAPNLYRPIERWHNLYSFSRNLSTSFYLAFLYCFASVWLQRPVLLEVAEYPRAIVEALPLCFLACSAILAVRYYYLYMSKHSRLLYRTFVYLCRRGPDAGQAREAGKSS